MPSAPHFIFHARDEKVHVRNDPFQKSFPINPVDRVLHQRGRFSPETERKIKDAIVTTAFDSGMEFQFTNLIPSQIPYATVVNKPWSDDYLFHVEPNDEAMGSLMAKLVSLYCRKRPISP